MENGLPHHVVCTFNENYRFDGDIEFLANARADVLNLVGMIRGEDARSLRQATTTATTYPALVGAALASIRRRAGATIEDAAVVLGITPSRLRSIERGAVAVDATDLRRFAAATGEEPGAIMSRADAGARLLESRGVLVLSRRMRPGDAANAGVAMLESETLAEVLVEASK